VEADDATLARWLDAAKARHRHIPKGPERDRLVALTLREIQHEAELQQLELPALTVDERRVLLEEAFAQVTASSYEAACVDGSSPLLDEITEELEDARIDELFARLCMRAREQKASPEVRARLITRRIARRWTGA
jgi:hypothetical protein